MNSVSTVFFYSPPQDFTTPNKSCLCWRDDVKNCLEMEQGQRADTFEMDIDDIADSVMRVMQICRLRPWEVRRTKELIKRSFRHYDEIRYRIDRVPNKRFNKENFLHDLAVESGMSRMDGQLAYGIVKRAFRAYYHGTGEGGKRLESMAKKMKHRSECLWLHAAKRTAEIYAVYAGLMYSEQKQYEECIECVFKDLHEELQSRLAYEDPDPKGCKCGKDEPIAQKSVNTVSAVSGSSARSENIAITTEIFFNKQTMNISKQTSPTSIRLEYLLATMEVIVSNSEKTSKSKQTLSSFKQTVKTVSSHLRKKHKKHHKCKCPKMECIKQQQKPEITAECSQGPFICRWVPFNEQEPFPEHRVRCPVICLPCDFDERPCDEECTCTCQLCRCKPAYDELVEEEHGEKLSGSGLEDRDTDYCWLAPFRDWPRVEMEEQLQESEMVEEDVTSEDGPFKCRCTCEYKQRAFPHLFTYLMPFKSVKQIPEKQLPAKNASKDDLKIKHPPCGISPETFRCWMESKESVTEEDSTTNCRECPHIALLSAVHDPPPNKVAGIIMDVTVKTQHYPSPGKNQPTRGQQTKSSRIFKNENTVKKSTIAALESDMKSVQAQKPAPPAAKLPEPAKTVPQTAAPQPQRAPNPVAAPAPSPDTAPRKSEDKLTKDDILDMLGLNK